MGEEVGMGPCHPDRMPPTETLMPSFARRIVQNSFLGMGVGERHWRIVWRDFGFVVIASKVCYTLLDT
jgi:hypothetical protein